jgi:hypothetical protein
MREVLEDVLSGDDQTESWNLSSVKNLLRNRNINMMHSTESDVSGSVTAPQRVEII